MLRSGRRTLRLKRTASESPPSAETSSTSEPGGPGISCSVQTGVSGRFSRDGRIGVTGRAGQLRGDLRARVVLECPDTEHTDDNQRHRGHQGSDEERRPAPGLPLLVRLGRGEGLTEGGREFLGCGKATLREDPHQRHGNYDRCGDEGRRHLSC